MLDFKVLISIVTYNSSTLIHNCLKCLDNLTFANKIITIFDNGSKDNTIRILQTFVEKKSNVFIESSRYNLGFGAGHNYNLNHYDFDYALLVNPDILIDQPNYIEIAIEKINSRPGIGGVGGILYDYENSRKVVDGCGLSLQLNRQMTLNYNRQYVDQLSLKDENVFGFDGALPFFSRSMIEDLKINGDFFDPLFFMHKEDWDICWRARLRNWEFLFTPELSAFHPRGFKPNQLGNRQKQSAILKVHAIKNQYILQLKNDYMSGILLHLFFFLPRYLFVFFYLLAFERKSIKAYYIILRNINIILENRKMILQNASVSFIQFWKNAKVTRR